MNNGLLLLGSNARTVACLRALLSRGTHVRAVALDGTSPELQRLAAEAGIPTIDARAPRTDPCRRALSDVGASLWVMAGYRRILPIEVIALAPEGVLNLHGGRLSDYRGGSVIPWQIIEGESHVGLTILYTDEGIDTGDVVTEERLSIDPDEDVGSVQRRVNDRFGAMLVDVLAAIASGSAVRIPQDRTKGRTWRQRKPEDGVIAWGDLGARRVHDFVRAITRPYPGAFTFCGDHRVDVWRARVVEENGRHGSAGEILAIADGRVRVACAEGIVELLEIEGRDASLVRSVILGRR